MIKVKFLYMELLFVTGNLHKKEEMARILTPHSVIFPKELGLDFPRIDENGSTYMDNALIKAQAFSGRSPYPILADDSGLSVPILNGAPGIYSARYGSVEAGRELSSVEKNELLLKKMEGMKGEARRAFFVCCMGLLVDEHRVFTVQETVSGYIRKSAAGSGGFGYDPVFSLSSGGDSVATMSPEEKDKISHRGRAGQRMKSLLGSLEALL